MKRIEKLLPNRFYLDKNFYPLREEIMKEFEKDQKRFSNDIYKMFSQEKPRIIVREIIHLVLSSIKPKYNLKEKKFY